MIDLNTFWANTPTEDVQELLDNMDVFTTMPKRAWLRASLKAELRRRAGEDVPPLNWTIVKA